MTSKKLGELLRSVPPATAETSRTSTSAVTMEDEPATSSLRDMKAKADAENEVPLQVLIPARIRKQLALKAAEEGQSLRALMLRAIRSLDIPVTDSDIKGKRGRRPL